MQFYLSVFQIITEKMLLCCSTYNRMPAQGVDPPKTVRLESKSKMQLLSGNNPFIITTQQIGLLVVAVVFYKINSNINMNIHNSNNYNN